jgi:hypothetical protein
MRISSAVRGCLVSADEDWTDGSISNRATGFGGAVKGQRHSNFVCSYILSHSLVVPLHLTFQPNNAISQGGAPCGENER